jgi:hypothetical protein
MSGAGAAHAVYYRPAEVARMLRCSEWWVKEQARRRRIPFSWIGGSYLFTEEHIAAIVRLFEVRPVERTGPIAAACAARRPVSDRDGHPPVLLQARVPRRARGAATTKPSAA